METPEGRQVVLDHYKWIINDTMKDIAIWIVWLIPFVIAGFLLFQ